MLVAANSIPSQRASSRSKTINNKSISPTNRRYFARPCYYSHCPTPDTTTSAVLIQWTTLSTTTSAFHTTLKHTTLNQTRAYCSLLFLMAAFGPQLDQLNPTSCNHEPFALSNEPSWMPPDCILISTISNYVLELPSKSVLKTKKPINICHLSFNLGILIRKFVTSSNWVICSQ